MGLTIFTQFLVATSGATANACEGAADVCSPLPIARPASIDDRVANTKMFIVTFPELMII